MDLGFKLVGFLAVVAAELVGADVSVVILWPYSTDYVLVRRDNLNNAIRRPEELGCTTKES